MTNEQLEYLLKTPGTKPYIRFTHNLDGSPWTIAKFSIKTSLNEEIIIKRNYVTKRNNKTINFYFIKLIWNDCDKTTKKRITNWLTMLAKHSIKVDVSSLPQELAALFILS